MVPCAVTSHLPAAFFRRLSGANSSLAHSRSKPVSLSCITGAIQICAWGVPSSRWIWAASRFSYPYRAPNQLMLLSKNSLAVFSSKASLLETMNPIARTWLSLTFLFVLSSPMRRSTAFSSGTGRSSSARQR